MIDKQWNKTSSIKIEVSILILIWMLTAGFFVWKNQQSLPALKQLPHQLQCMSYAPYYKPGQTPQLPSMYIERAQIEQDLKVLSAVTNCVRTYSVGQGLDVVPEVAHALGMKAFIGAWVSWTDEDNLAEIALAVKRANAYPDTVKGVVVGNEVLLRREQSERKMHDYLQWAQAHTDVPVTYADVWEFWLKHPNLEQDVDFITVHILPYWEDAPVPIQQAALHTEAVMNKLGARFKKSLLIGETGWPSAGRQRFGAEPSLLNEARYLRDFLEKAHEHGWQYNFIEAIDQPWKRDLEGTVGGYWGVFDAQLKPKFSMDGAVYARQDGLTPWLMSFGFTLFFGVLAYFFKNNSESPKKLVTIKQMLVGAIIGFAIYLQAEYLLQACRNTTEWLALGGVVVFGDVLCVYLGIFNITSKQKVFSNGVLILLATMLYASYCLFVDGRYRNFPTILYLFPVLLLLANGFAKLTENAALAFDFSLKSSVCFLIGVSGLVLSALVWRLEPQNEAALYWTVLLFVTYSLTLIGFRKNEIGK